MLKHNIHNQSGIHLKLELGYQSLKGIDIKLQDRITVVTGKSGTGKTLLVETLKNLKTLTEFTSKYPVLNNIQTIMCNNQYECLADEIKSSTNQIFILDEADKYGVFKNPELYNLIKNDSKNTYIIMSREHTQANIATLQITDGTIQLI